MASKQSSTLYFLVLFGALIGTPAMGQAAGVKAKLDGKIVGGSLRFKGTVNLGIFSRRGIVIGKLSNGSRCTGKAWVNFLFSKGGGSMKCRNGLSIKYTFLLSSKFPVRGKGKGIVSDGRKAVFTIRPAK